MSTSENGIDLWEFLENEEGCPTLDEISLRSEINRTDLSALRTGRRNANKRELVALAETFEMDPKEALGLLEGRSDRFRARIQRAVLGRTRAKKRAQK